MDRRSFFSSVAGVALAGSAKIEYPAIAARAHELARGHMDFAPNGGLMTAHQWGYYHAEVTGSPAPPPHEIGLGDGFGLLTVGAYYRAMERA